MSTFKEEIQGSLTAGVNLRTQFTFECRTDVFLFLFSGKGREWPKKYGRFYDLDDFDQVYFPSKWYIVYDRLGSGCTVEFPIRMYSKIKWTPVVCDKDESGSIIQKKKVLQESLQCLDNKKPLLSFVNCLALSSSLLVDMLLVYMCTFIIIGILNIVLITYHDDDNRTKEYQFTFYTLHAPCKYDNTQQ